MWSSASSDRTYVAPISNALLMLLKTNWNGVLVKLRSSTNSYSSLANAPVAWLDCLPRGALRSDIYGFLGRAGGDYDCELSFLNALALYMIFGLRDGLFGMALFAIGLISRPSILPMFKSGSWSVFSEFSTFVRSLSLAMIFARDALIATFPFLSENSLFFFADALSYVWAVLVSTVDPLVDGTSFFCLNLDISEIPFFSTLLLREPLESAFTLASDFLTDLDIPLWRCLVGKPSATWDRRLSVIVSLRVDLLTGALSV